MVFDAGVRETCTFPDARGSANNGLGAIDLTRPLFTLALGTFAVGTAAVSRGFVAALPGHL
jgi:hypothetical protein